MNNENHWYLGLNLERKPIQSSGGRASDCHSLSLRFLINKLARVVPVLTAVQKNKWDDQWNKMLRIAPHSQWVDSRQSLLLPLTYSYTYLPSTKHSRFALLCCKKAFISPCYPQDFETIHWLSWSFSCYWALSWHQILNYTMSNLFR